jgi:ribosomal protein S27AE
MNQNDEYNKTCPFCNKQFLAKHLSRVYCSEVHKRRMFRKKKQLAKKEIAADREALVINDLKLEDFFEKGKVELIKADLDEVKFNHKCYDRCYQIDNFNLYTFKNYALLEMKERNYIIYKSYNHVY